MEQLQKLASVAIGPLKLGDILSALALFIVCYLVIRLLAMALHKALCRYKRIGDSLRGFMESVIKFVLWILAFIIIAGSLGIPTDSLVAAVSVIGLAMSLSVQNILANIFSGITLFVTKPFAPGDFVEIAGKTGNVKSVGLFYTVLDTFENTHVNIPNADVTAAAVTDYSAEPIRRLDLTFPAPYDAPTDLVEEALLEAAEEAAPVLADPAPFAAIREYKGGRIDYALRVWCRTEDYWDAVFAVNDRVRSCFAERGVHMRPDELSLRTDRQEITS